MERGTKKETKYQSRFFIYLIVLIAVALAWFGFFYITKTCDDQNCFDKELSRCNRARFIGGESMIFEYTIKEKSGESCFVNLKLIQGELNNQDSIKLEGKSMICSIPLGIIITPESNIINCHGLLKEGIQDIYIERLHKYLVQNIGRINLELFDIQDYIK